MSNSEPNEERAIEAYRAVIAQVADPALRERLLGGTAAMLEALRRHERQEQQNREAWAIARAVAAAEAYGTLNNGHDQSHILLNGGATAAQLVARARALLERSETK